MRLPRRDNFDGGEMIFDGGEMIFDGDAGALLRATAVGGCRGARLAGHRVAQVLPAAGDDLCGLVEPVLLLAALEAFGPHRCVVEREVRTHTVSC